MTLTPTHEPIVITQYQVLLDDIEQAKKEQIATFAYETKEGDKAARSYLFHLRKLRARIESARKDAKAYALAYGKQVDNQAKELSSQVDELIQPHQEQLEAIARREAERVQAHRNVLQQIRDLAQVPFGSGANQIAVDLAGAKDLDIDGLEEFKEKAAAALLETIRTLEAAHAKALADEAAAAELEQLREQQRIQQEKEAEDARIKAQQEAIAEAARKAQEEADAAALLAIQEAEQKVAEAEARAAAAEARAADSEAVAALLEGEALLAITPAEVPVAVEQEHGTFVVEIGGPLVCGASEAAKKRLTHQLLHDIRGMDRVEVVSAIVNGHLHPALQINWGAVQ
jgi:colicin import membrane protein